MYKLRCRHFSGLPDLNQSKVLDLKWTSPLLAATRSDAIAFISITGKFTLGQKHDEQGTFRANLYFSRVQRYLPGDRSPDFPQTASRGLVLIYLKLN